MRVFYLMVVWKGIDGKLSPDRRRGEIPIAANVAGNQIH